MSLKKPTRSKTSATSKKSSTTTPRTRSKKSKTSTKHFGAGTILVAALCVTGAVMVIAAHEMTPASRAAAEESQPETAGTSMPAVSERTSTAESAIATPPDSDAPAATSTAGMISPVTVFGCLERSDENFRLTDTDGVDAPRARSWKTGFLKKGAASIEVMDPANRVKLSSHVGQRVSVTGTLTDRQMQVRSLRRISASCN